MKTMYGNEAAAYAAYALTEVAGIYPITPSSNMAEYTDEWAAKGKKNIFGQTVSIVEMQSEAGAAGTVHGSLQAGALTTTYTASQGLLLMIPNMYKIAGELLPCVIHVSARAVAGHALSIFGDHSDIYACRQTGFAFLASNNVQQAMDLGAVAHLSAISARVPFVHFFDGFRTSHEMQKIDVLDYDDIARIADRDAINAFRNRALNPEHPVLRGTAQNPDIFFQAKEASNIFYNNTPAVVEKYMGEINKLTGRNYKLFNYYGADDADRVIVAMGSACDAIEETIDYLSAKGEKVGLVTVHLFRPFSNEHLLNAIPAPAKTVCVLDRAKEPGAPGEPLYLDVCAAVLEAGRTVKVLGGRYGLGSKDFTPAQIVAVYDNMKAAEPKNHFTVGITDDVTNTSLKVGNLIDVTPEGTVSCKFWGIGADGTVGANSNSITIIGDRTDKYAQAYFSYDSKKSGGVTQSHLRFGNKPVKSPYLVRTADFVACHVPSYVDKYDMAQEVKPGGTFLLNCLWNEAELDKHLPGQMKRYIAENNIKLYTIDATAIARELGLGSRTNTVLQAAFFKLAEIIPADDAVKHMKAAISDTYGNKGEKVVNMNYAAVDRGVAEVKQVNVPDSWKDAVDVELIGKTGKTDELSVFVDTIARPVNALKGELLPVSAFTGREDGTFLQGTAAYEKRGVAVDVPEWVCENCIQCNLCSYVCPHATIRPFLLTDDEAAAKPNGYKVLDGMKAHGCENYKYTIQVTPLDCYGCGVCAEVCPGKRGEKALVMKPIASQTATRDNWYYSLELSVKDNPMDAQKSVKGSQFEKPLLEFSGACAGCGETPYAKLITQLFGDRMYIGNATGCSSIWGGSAPSTPYCVNHKGHGPAWANSLFEDTAEFTYGFALAVRQRREKLAGLTNELLETDVPANVKETGKAWLETMHNGGKSKAASAAYLAALEGCAGNCGGERCKSLIAQITAQKDVLVKKSFWCFGGDGFAYDIGFGGLDHVLASGEDVNVLVFDTEVYSNTGGQSSKASPAASIAKFTYAGKRMKKKDLGLMAISYGYVYVAQIAMGASYKQTLDVIVEAEAYPGPSLIIAYAPCIAHGIKKGMGRTMEQTKNAVNAGYWHMYRHNPLLAEQGKNPFILESPKPEGDFLQFLESETRYSSLKLSFPNAAQNLYERSKKDAEHRYNTYKRLAEQEYD